MKNKIYMNLQVAGNTSIGKTTLIALIIDTLNKSGIKYNLTYNNPDKDLNQKLSNLNQLINVFKEKDISISLNADEINLNRTLK